MEVTLGEIVSDQVTGYVGRVTARCEYLSGQVRCEVTSANLSDGKIVEEWFDETRLRCDERATAREALPTRDVGQSAAPA